MSQNSENRRFKLSIGTKKLRFFYISNFHVKVDLIVILTYRLTYFYKAFTLIHLFNKYFVSFYVCNGAISIEALQNSIHQIKIESFKILPVVSGDKQKPASRIVKIQERSNHSFQIYNLFDESYFLNIFTLKYVIVECINLLNGAAIHFK